MALYNFYVFFAILFVGIGFINAMYGCPNNFSRCGVKCYNLSATKANWDYASMSCRENLQSQLAKPDTRNQARSLRACLNKDFIPNEEKWIDGIYDGTSKQWLWGSSAESMTYNAFSRVSLSETPDWSCAALNPKLHHKWSIRSCAEEKLYLCEVPLLNETSST